MMRIPQLGDDAVRLRFISFSLKDLVKKWLYSLAVDSVTTWDDFVKAFLKKFYPIHKTALIRKKYHAVQARIERAILEIL